MLQTGSSGCGDAGQDCRATLTVWVKTASSAANQDDLVKCFAREPKRLFGHLLPRMWLSCARSPIKRLGLMPEDVAHCALRTYETNRERVGLVVARLRQRQTYHDAGAHIEFPRRQHQQGMYVLHLPTDLRTAVDPDHVTATRTPGQAPSHQSSSAPMRCVAITSPPR